MTSKKTNKNFDVQSVELRTDLENCLFGQTVFKICFKAQQTGHQSSWWSSYWSFYTQQTLERNEATE